MTCWGTGSPMREFLHVDDLAEASVFALERWMPSEDEAQFLNVGTGVDITIKDLAQLISELIGYQGQILWDTSKPDGTPKKLLDVGKINDLGLESKNQFEEWP